MYVDTLLDVCLQTVYWILAASKGWIKQHTHTHTRLTALFPGLHR